MKKKLIRKDKNRIRPEMRTTIPTRKVFKDKTKYNRKSKHKKGW